MKLRTYRALVMLLCVALPFGLASCTTMGSSNAEHSTVAPPPPPPDNYYDFNDVAVPNEMTLRSKESFILETPTTRTGVMSFDGKVEAVSLRNYYINTMARDGWTMRSAIKSSKSLLLFEKPDKYAAIIITDRALRTGLEIWITPRSGAIGETGFSSMDSGANLVQ